MADVPVEVSESPIIEVFEVEDVQEVVSGVTQDYRDQTAAGISALSEDVQSLSEDVRTLGATVSTLGASPSTDEVTYVVELSEEQWETVRGCWVWAKSGLSTALFLLLLVTLLTSAVLGSRLWATFSEGWRHG